MICSPCEQKICEEIGTELKNFNPQKIFFKLSVVMVGSGIRKKPFPDPRSRGPKGTRSRIPDPDPQHWRYECSMNFNPVNVTFEEKHMVSYHKIKDFGT